MATESAQVNLTVTGGEASARTVASLKKELREAQSEALRLTQLFGESSQEALQAAKRVAEIKDEQQSLNERVQLFDPGAKYKALGNSVSAVAGGFAAAQGAMALFGTESEDLQKQMVKLQGALALTEGLSRISDSAKDFTLLAGVIKSQVVSAFSTLRGAIISTGIGALVVGIASLVANAGSLEKAIQKLFPTFKGFGALLNDVMAFFSGIVDAATEVLKNITQVGDILAKFFTFDFAGALASAKDFGNKVGNAFNQGVAESRTQQLREAAAAQLEAQAQELKRTIDSRKAAGKAYADLEKQMLEKEAAAKLLLQGESSKEYLDAVYALHNQELATEREKNEKLKAERQKAADEALAVLNDLESRRRVFGLNELNREVSDLSTKYQEQRKVLLKAGKDAADLEEQFLRERQAIYDKFDAQRLAGAQKVLDELNQKQDFRTKSDQEGELMALQAKYDTDKRMLEASFLDTSALTEQFHIDQAATKKKYADQEDAEKKKRRDEEHQKMLADYEAQLAFDQAQLESKKALVGGVSQLLGQASDALGKSTAAGKSLAIGQATIDTLQTVGGIIKSYAGTGPWGIALGAVLAAAAGISGYARVKQIASVKVPGSSSNAPAISTAATGAPSVSQPNALVAGQSTMIQQLQEQSQEPVRAYVVESEMTNSQAKVRKIEEKAQF